MSFQAATPRLILASGSAARKAVLAAAGIIFEARVAAVDEAALKAGARAEGLSVEDTALMLADMKAQRVARLDPEALVIGCDQMLVCGISWFDKPADMAEARQHLLALRGVSHTLVTAVVCRRGGARIWQHVARPRLTMRDFSEAFLDHYLTVEGETVLTSVGAYRLEGIGVQLFDAIAGEQSEILGLPMLPLLGFLRQHGVVHR